VQLRLECSGTARLNIRCQLSGRFLPKGVRALSSERKEEDGIAGFFKDHWFSLTSVALGVFVIVKVYAAARFSLTTAGALLTTSPLTMFLGTIVTYSYQFFAIVAVGLAGLGIVLSEQRRWVAPLSWYVTAGAVASALLAPIVDLIAMLTLLLLLLAIRTIYCRVKTSNRVSWRTMKQLVDRKLLEVFVVVAFTQMIALTLTNLWVPVEVVLIEEPASTNRSAIVGHVLGYDGDWLVVLRAYDRGVMQLRSDSVEERQLCHLIGGQPTSRPPLLVVLISEPRSPNRSCTRILDARRPVTLIPGSISPEDTAEFEGDGSG
jgi:hypothetical protein